MKNKVIGKNFYIIYKILTIPINIVRELAFIN